MAFWMKVFLGHWKPGKVRRETSEEQGEMCGVKILQKSAESGRHLEKSVHLHKVTGKPAFSVWESLGCKWKSWFLA